MESWVVTIICRAFIKAAIRAALRAAYSPDKHQKRGGIRYKSRRAGDAVGNGTAAEFAHAIVDVITCRILFQRGRTFPDSQAVSAGARSAVIRPTVPATGDRRH